MGLGKLFKSGAQTDRDRVRAALIALKSRDQCVEIELPDAQVTGGMKLQATVESVGEDEVRIGQPFIGAELQTICKGERVRLRFALPQGVREGDGTCVGRAKMIRKDGSEVHGYRISLPATLGPATVAAAKKQPAVRRQAPPKLPEGELLTDSKTGKVFGAIEDITPLAVRMICRNAEGKLTEGQLVHFKARMPAPIGSLKEMARVTMIMPGKKDGLRVVTILFRERVQALEALEPKEDEQKDAA